MLNTPIIPVCTAKWVPTDHRRSLAIGTNGKFSFQHPVLTRSLVEQPTGNELLKRLVETQDAGPCTRGLADVLLEIKCFLLRSIKSGRAVGSRENMLALQY